MRKRNSKRRLFTDIFLLVFVFAASLTGGEDDSFQRASDFLRTNKQKLPESVLLSEFVENWPAESSKDVEDLLTAAARALKLNDTDALNVIISDLSRKIRNRLEDQRSPDTGQKSIKIGRSLLKAYYLTESADYFRLAQSVSSDGDMVSLAATSNLGVVHEFEGRYSSALEAYFQIYKKSPEKSGAYIAACLNLGRLYRKLDRPIRSRDFYDKALTLSKADPKLNRQYALALNGLGMWHKTKGDLVAARQQLTEATQLLADPRERATCERNLGLLAMENNDLNSATNHFTTSLTLLATNGFGSTPEYATTLLAMANVFVKQGKSDRSVQLIERFGKQVVRTFDESSQMYAYYLSNYASIMEQRGEFKKAEQAYVRALRILEEQNGEGHIESVGLRLNLAHLSLAKDPNRSFDECLAAMNIIKQHLDRMAVVQDEYQQAYTLSQYRVALGLLLSIAGRERTLTPEVYDQVLEFKARPLRRAILAHAVRSVPEFDEITRERHELMAKLSRSRVRGDGAVAAIAGEQREHLQRLGKLNEKINELVYRSLAGETDKQQTIRLQDSLSESEAVLDYLLAKPSFESRDNLFVFLVKRGQLELVDLGSVVSVDSNICDWLVAIGNEEKAGITSVGGRLRDQLWGTNDKQSISPARFCAGIKTVIICPDGQLFRIPFDALPEGDHGHLIDNHAFVVCPFPASISSGNRQPTESSATALVVGEIDYSRNRLSETDLPQLEQLGTVAETSAAFVTLSSLFPGADVKRIQGSAATKEAVTNLIEEAGWVHLATHATADLDTIAERVGVLVSHDLPWMNCGLAFAGANVDSFDKGFLTGNEVSMLRLPRDSTVVLSACETSVGKIFECDGVFGLQRAFHVAGASRVISSEWNVNDAATAELMREFYKNLGNGEAVTESLRKAKITVRDKFNPLTGGIARGISGVKLKTNSPRLWAAFSLSGNWK